MHHAEFEESNLDLKKIRKMIDEKRILYDLNVDQRTFKWKGDKKLKKVNLSEMPEYLSQNYKKYSNCGLSYQ